MRLAGAIEAGLVFPKAEILVDNYGKTYMSAPPTVMGRTLGADLRRLEARQSTAASRRIPNHW